LTKYFDYNGLSVSQFPTFEQAKIKNIHGHPANPMIGIIETTEPFTDYTVAQLELKAIPGED
jgi:hypothetical protein